MVKRQVEVLGCAQDGKARATKKVAIFLVFVLVLSIAMSGCAFRGASGSWSQSNVLYTKQLTISSDESEWKLETHGLSSGTMSGSLEKGSEGEYLFYTEKNGSAKTLRSKATLSSDGNTLVCGTSGDLGGEWKRIN